jgi:hypothetical protein
LKPAQLRAYHDFRKQLVVDEVGTFLERRPFPSQSLLFFSYGFVDPGNPNDCLYQSVELLPTDRLMGFKKQIVEQAGFGVKEVFPLLLNRFPTQVGRRSFEPLLQFC